MNRVSRRSADEAAEALLEAGRSQPSLDYDVELGLARHHHWLRNEAPMPEWASASVGIAPKSLVASLIKTVVSTMLVGVLATAAWHARGILQPSAAAIPALPAAQPALPSAAEPAPSEVSLGLKPIPVPEHVLPSEPAPADVHNNKRAARVQRAHKEHAARREPAVSRAEPARVEPVAAGTPAASEAVNQQPATRTEVVASADHNSVSVARKPPSEAAQQAQAPGDLVEMQEVASAEQLLERSPARALALVRQGDQRFPRGYFQQERAYIAIMALIKLGRMDEARSRAASFDKHYPALPYGARIRSALEARKTVPAHDVAP